MYLKVYKCIKGHKQPSCLNTTIPISKEARDALKRTGRKDETYDGIIRNLLKASEIKKFYEEMERILETEEFVPLGKV